MSFLKGIKEVYRLFLKIGIRKKRTILLTLLSFTPLLLLLIAKIIEITKPHSSVSASHLYSNIIVAFYIQFIIGILSIFYGSSIVDEEVEGKTLIYLFSKPISKASILLGKFFSYITIIIITIISGLIISFIIAYFNVHVSYKTIIMVLKYIIASFFAIIAYTSIFTMLATFFKRTAIIGLLFIFGWESIVNYMPGKTQKLTVIHYIKSLIPQTAVNKNFLLFHLEPSSSIISIIVLSLIAVISVIIAVLVFKHKEYII
jgi:ABC-2 type transport system permease protein